LCKGTAFFTYKQDCYTNFYAKLIKIYLLQSFLRIAKFFSLFPFHFSPFPFPLSPFTSPSQGSRKGFIRLLSDFYRVTDFYPTMFVVLRPPISSYASIAAIYPHKIDRIAFYSSKKCPNTCICAKNVVPLHPRLKNLSQQNTILTLCSTVVSGVSINICRFIQYD